MTKTISSETSNKHYFLTIDETGHATDCSCPDRFYRHHTCKHMRNFQEEVERAQVFLALKQDYDCRANGQEQTRRCYYEMSLGY